MQRIKTFDSTGVPPDGELYAPDLNEIQDAAAGQQDDTQTILVGVLQVGDNTIQLLKYGTGIAQLTAELKVAGIIFPDSSVQTSAVVPGSSGHFIGEPIWGWPSLSLPSWLSEVWGWQDGSAVSRTTYALLLAQLVEAQSGIRNTGSPTIITGLSSTAGLAIGMAVEGTGIPSGTIISSIDSLSQIHISKNVTSSGTSTVTVFPHGNGDGSTTFNLPDARGRVPVGLALSGGHIDVAGIGNNEGVSATNRRVKHKHTNGLTATSVVSESPHTHNFPANSHGPSSGEDGVVQDSGAAEDHTITTSGATTGLSVGTTLSGLIGNSTNDALDAPSYLVLPAPIRMA